MDVLIPSKIVVFLLSSFSSEYIVGYYNLLIKLYMICSMQYI